MYLWRYIQQFGLFQRNARLYLISYVLSGVTTGIFLVLYNLYLISLGYRSDFIGLVLFVGTIGAGLAIFPAGLCVDRFSGKSILIWSSVLIGIAGLGQIVFRDPLSLLLTAFIAGIGAAFTLVINAPFLIRNSTPEERAHLFSMNLVLSLITIVVGKVLGGALPGWFRSLPWLMSSLPSWSNALLAQQPEPRSYQFALLFAGAIAGPSFIPLFLMHNDLVRRGPIDRARRPVDQTSSWFGRNTSGPYEARSFARIFTFVKSYMSFPQLISLAHSPIFLLTLVQVLIGLGAGLFIPYTNIYFVEHLKAAPWLYGLIDGSTTAITALLTLIAPFLAIRFGKVRSVIGTEVASIPLLLLLGFIPILPLAALFYLFRQGLMDMSNGVLQVFSMEAIAPQHRGVANSSYQAGFQVAWAITAPIGGLLIATLGYVPVFVGAAICYTFANVLLWARFGRGRQSYRGERGNEKEKSQSEISALSAEISD
ncbi:MAG: MFS transporter [Chloroflexota bacterium]|nr:MFS transporter [Chloroflexota bacterium]